MLPEMRLCQYISNVSSKCQQQPAREISKFFFGRAIDGFWWVSFVGCVCVSFGVVFFVGFFYMLVGVSRCYGLGFLCMLVGVMYPDVMV